MAAYVPVRWVAPLLYGAVLTGGLYYARAGLGDTPGPTPPRLSAFVAAIAARFAWKRSDTAGPRPACRCCRRGAG
ncbi:hypothetical protein AB0I77_06360 [Streptomyces sp. NPDC050619]|uniref:hypothetical protein n=1 Tax=Streptomyces sp. NPDC050619 TaxID=3157214 RepID=UPI003437F775